MATFPKRSGSWQALIQRKGHPDLAKSLSSKSGLSVINGYGHD